jgi:hypothetical protein
LVYDVLVQGMTMEQVGQRRELTTQRWRDYFSRRFCECLDRLALIYGFATEKRQDDRATIRREIPVDVPCDVNRARRYRP